MEEEGLIFPTTTTMLSTRELGAKLWEILPQPRVRSISSKNKDTPSSSSPPDEMADSGLIVGRTSSSFQTSAEFLNMLNRIWNMEEQHASNLKTELDQSRARIIELTRDKQKLDPLVKKKKKKKKEEESALMDDEREFRKLAQEVTDLRISLSDALKNLDKERDYRILLEDICDEFAKGVRDYENELQSLKREIGDNHQVNRESCHDMLILHLSEAWIDERMQMKQQLMESERTTVVDKLKFEIETFLQAKHDLKCRHSFASASASASSVKEMMKSSLRERLQEARLEEGMHSLKNI